MTNRSAIRSLWHSCLKALGADPASSVSQRQHTALVNRYTVPDRHYHNLTHIASMIRFLSAFDANMEHPSELYLAVLFHDAVYDSRAHDNEEQSAELAERMLRELGASDEIIERIARLILSTKQHQALIESMDNALLLDADLSILASSEQEYRNYAAGIREEYGWVPEEDYRKGRAMVLKRFLDRERIFLVEDNHHALDSPARENLVRELRELKVAED